MSSRIEIIIATYNRCQSLKDTLDSLVRQTCDWSSISAIWIVDNNSTDKTYEVVNTFKKLFKTELKYIKEIRQGKSWSLNSGIQASNAEILLFTDDDVICDENWLSEIINLFRNEHPDIVGGRVLPLYPSNAPSWIKNNQYELRGPIVSFDHGKDVLNYHMGEVSAFIGANIAYRKEILTKAGLFNTSLGPGQGTFGDDTEMFERAVRLSKKILYNGKAVVFHKVDPERMSLMYIASWNFRNGKYKAIRENQSGQLLKTFAHVPVYLIRRVFLESIVLPLKLFTQKNFLKHWCSVCFSWGMAAGYREKRL